jgi:hypothetical protein
MTPGSSFIWGLPLHSEPHYFRYSAQRRLFACVSLLSAIFLLAGCQRPHVDQPMTQSLPPDPIAGQLEFWHGMENRPVTCNDEAFHGLLLFVKGDDDSKGYDERVAALKSMNLLSKGFNAPGQEAVQRGTVASALVRVLKIKGGWVMTVIGPTPRYATREMMYLNLFPPSSPEQTFSGSEFLGIMGRAEDYQRGHPEEAPATDMGPH